ncbi:MAG: hypothetical protein JRH15_10120, partial [Deltaproteobacteria bacterium]|nr:hypothetical protein [Deltaproteobacteria bacterium]
MTTENSRVSFSNRISNFLIREDREHDDYGDRYQAKSPALKAFYLFFHLLPGIVVYVAINIESVYNFLVAITGLPGRTLQYVVFFILTFGWHMMIPVLVLRYNDKLTFKESIDFLGLGVKRMDWKGIFVFLPVIIVIYTLITIPYMAYVFPVLKS